MGASRAAARLARGGFVRAFADDFRYNNTARDRGVRRHGANELIFIRVKF